MIHNYEAVYSTAKIEAQRELPRAIGIIDQIAPEDIKN